MARLRGRGVRKQVAARATKESSEASSDGEGSESGSRRLRNGRRSTPEEPQATRRSSRNRKAVPEDNSRDDSDAATEPESPPGDHGEGKEEGQALSPVREEEEEQPTNKQAAEQAGSSSEGPDSSEEEEAANEGGPEGAKTSGGEASSPSQPSSSEPVQEEDTKSQEEEEDTQSQEEPAKQDEADHCVQESEEVPAGESKVAEDVEMKEEEEHKEPTSDASEPVPDASEPIPDSSPTKPKTRKLSTAALKKDPEDKEERPLRKRKWGSTDVVLGPSVSISSAALKDLIPDIEEPVSRAKESEDEQVSASVGESPVAEIEEASDEPPIKLAAVEEEPISEDAPAEDDSAENDGEKNEVKELSPDDRAAVEEDKAAPSREGRPKEDRLARRDRKSVV